MKRFFARLGTRRTLTAAFLIAILVGAFTATNTWVVSAPSASAGSCGWHGDNWKLRAGSVALNIGKVEFGATICTDNRGRISSVSPTLGGGIEGAGTYAGFVFDNLGAKVTRQTDTFVEVQGTSKVKSCLPGLKSTLCSLTDTQRYTLRFSAVHGPFLKKDQPGIFTSSKTCQVNGSCYAGVRFVR